MSHETQLIAIRSFYDTDYFMPWRLIKRPFTKKGNNIKMYTYVSYEKCFGGREEIRRQKVIIMMPIEMSSSPHTNYTVLPCNWDIVKLQA